jgi:hypothetical protein
VSTNEKHIHYFASSIGWNLCCKQATFLLLKKEESVKLTFKEESALKFHMAICRFCKLFKKQSAIMNKLIHESIASGTLRMADVDKNNLKSLINSGLNEI